MRRKANMQPNSAIHQTAEETVLEFLSTEETNTCADVEQLTEVSTASAARILRKMVESGALIRIGEGKNTKYRLVKG